MWLSLAQLSLSLFRFFSTCSPVFLNGICKMRKLFPKFDATILVANILHCHRNNENKLRLSFAKLSKLFFKFGVCLVFAVKDRLSLRYGSVRNLLLKHHPNGIWEFRIWKFGFLKLQNLKIRNLKIRNLKFRNFSIWKFGIWNFEIWNFEIWKFVNWKIPNLKI